MFFFSFDFFLSETFIFVSQVVQHLASGTMYKFFEGFSVFSSFDLHHSRSFLYRGAKVSFASVYKKIENHFSELKFQIIRKLNFFDYKFLKVY